MSGKRAAKNDVTKLFICVNYCIYIWYRFLMYKVSLYISLTEQHRIAYLIREWVLDGGCFTFAKRPFWWEMDEHCTVQHEYYGHIQIYWIGTTNLDGLDKQNKKKNQNILSQYYSNLVVQFLRFFKISAHFLLVN